MQVMMMEGVPAKMTNDRVTDLLATSLLPPC
jgi:hypothetical protein